MIEPSKHLNLELSVIRVTALILKQLNKRRILKYDELTENLIKTTNMDVCFMISPALSLLYLLGKVEYHEKTDSFEYLSVENKKNET